MDNEDLRQELVLLQEKLEKAEENNRILSKSLARLQDIVNTCFSDVSLAMMLTVVCSAGTTLDDGGIARNFEQSSVWPRANS